MDSQLNKNIFEKIKSQSLNLTDSQIQIIIDIVTTELDLAEQKMFEEFITFASKNESCDCGSPTCIDDECNNEYNKNCDFDNYNPNNTTIH